MQPPSTRRPIGLPPPAARTALEPLPRRDGATRTRGARAPAAAPPPADARETAAAAARRREAARVTTAPGDASHARAAASLSAGGRVTTPNLVAKPVDVLQRLDTGTLELSVPMTGGAELGSVTVRPDTHARVQLALRDGKVDFENTRLDFRTSDGEETDLDGPLWWNVDAIYIDDNGQIRADVPCFPDPNITEDLLGEGIDRLPDDPTALMQRLAQGRNPEIPVAESRTETFGAMPETPSARGATAGSSGPAAAPAEDADASEKLRSIFDLSALQASFTGSFAAGPISFGPGATLVLDEGSTVNIRGNLDDMQIDVDAPVRSLAISSDGTRLRSGPGRVGFGVHLQNADDESGFDDAGVSITALNANGVSLETPGQHGTHRLEIGHLDVSGAEGRAPLVHTRKVGDADRQLSIDLPRVAVDGIRGEFQITGADGNPATVTLGDPTGAGEMGVEAAIRFDSATGDFSFDSTVQNLRAGVGTVSLVDTPAFDMTLREATIGGSGTFAVDHRDGRSTLRMRASEGQDWTVTAHVDDAVIGNTQDAKGVIADLSSETTGTLRLKNFELGTSDAPVFAGSADIAVTLDRMRIPITGDQGLELRSGTQGTLRIMDMGWQPGDASPSVRAELRLDIGADAVLAPGEVQGLRGARVEVDVETGNAVVVLDATLDRNGHLTTDCGITLRDVGVRTTLAQEGVALPPPVNLPERPLPSTLPPLPMASARGLRPARSRPAETNPTAIAAPSLPAMRLNPGDMFRSVRDTTMTLSVPMDSFSGLRVYDLDTVRTTTTLGVDDDEGLRAYVDVTRGAGDVSASLAIRNGRVQPDVSRLTLDPPLTVDLFAQYYATGPIAPSASGTVTVRALIIKRDPVTGQGYLWPDMDLDGWVLDGAELVGLGDDIRREVGAQLATPLFGGPSFSLDRDDMLRVIESKAPIVGQPLVFGEPSSPSSSSSGSASRAPAPPSSSSSSSMPPAAAALLAKLHFEDANLSVSNARLSPTTIDLGNGQVIELREGTELTVSGSADDFTISGTANLGRVSLGGESNTALNLDGGSANVRLRVRRNEGGEPLIELAIDELQTDSLTARAPVGAGQAEITEASVRRGYVHMSRGGGRDLSLDVNLQDATVTVETQGRASALGVAGGADRLTAQATGSLRFNDGAVSGELTSFNLQGTGLDFAGAGVEAQGGTLSIVGAASISTDREGNIALARRNAETPPLTLNTDITMASGERLAIQDGSAERIVFSPTGGVRLESLHAQMSAVVRIGEGGDRLLDIRSAQVDGSMVIGPGGISTSGPVSLQRLDASLTNFGDGQQVDIEQLDLRGSGQIRVGTDGTWSIRGNQRRVGDEVHSTLRGSARARDLHFGTMSPKMDIDLVEGAQATFELEELAISVGGEGPPRGVRLSLLNAHIAGTVDNGAVTIGSEGSPLETVGLGPGTRVAADLEYLRLATGVFASGRAPAELPADFDLLGTLRVEGDVGGRGDDLRGTLGESGQPYAIEDIGVDGSFRMILGLRVDHGRFAVNSYADLSADLRARASTDIDTRGILERSMKQADAEVRSLDWKAANPSGPPSGS